MTTEPKTCDDETRDAEETNEIIELRRSSPGKITFEENSQVCQNFRFVLDKFTSDRDDASDVEDDDKEEGDSEGVTYKEECTCADISENLRINIRKKTKFTSEASGRDGNASPEVTHTISIAMKYRGPRKLRSAQSSPDKEIATETDVGSEFENQVGEIRGTNCCSELSVALGFTLNCNSIELTARDLALKSTGDKSFTKVKE